MAATVPAPERIRVDRETGLLDLAWPGEPEVQLTARQVRCHCRCAGCVDEITGQRILDVKAVLADLRFRAASLVGNYAIKFTFSDGHDAGVFTWPHLHELAGAAAT